MATPLTPNPSLLPPHTLRSCDTLLPTPKELTPDTVTSASHLEIPLMTAERAWAYGMQRKQETAEAPYRVRRHVATRLAKAAKVRLENGENKPLRTQ